MLDNSSHYERDNPSSKSINELQDLITELQQQMIQLEEEKRQLQEKNLQDICQLKQELKELKSRFITTVSHEFRTPLTTISFSAGLLENYSNKISEEKKHTHFQRIKQGIEQMTNLLEDILIEGKLEAGYIELNLTPTHLDKTCLTLIEKIQAKTNKHQIILNNQGVQEPVLVDESLLLQMLKNLLDNAIKYSPNGGQIELNLICNCHQNQIIFNLKDPGIGIPKKDQERLFTNFYRGTNIGTISGTGLGLSVVKKIVDLHQGEIKIKSEENEGTQVEVTLPLKNKFG